MKKLDLSKLKKVKGCYSSEGTSDIYYKELEGNLIIIQYFEGELVEVFNLKKESILNAFHGETKDFSFSDSTIEIILCNREESIIIDELTETLSRELLEIITLFILKNEIKSI